MPHQPDHSLKLSHPSCTISNTHRPSGAPPAPPTHEPDPAWRLQDHLAALRGLPAGNKPDSCPAAPVASWRDIYWDVWGVVHVLYCHHCLQYFPAQVRQSGSKRQQYWWLCLLEPFPMHRCKHKTGP